MYENTDIYIFKGILNKSLNISVDALIADHSDSMDESNLQLIMNDIRGMSKNQLEVLKDNIKTIKKFIE